ncbi:MAG: 3-phosphoshikimate 1-carboxyvinyltransferase [Legionellales bacterium]|nr:3-phosphoshikimate 1-carboxyvinyltransferase [Legionellales bacterium]
MQNFLVEPSRPALKTEISVPGDKSISHRAVMLGSIADGLSVIHHFLPGEDCLATINAMRDMGVSIEGPFDNNEVRVHGVGKYGLKNPQSILQLGNSGTSMRLLAGLLAGHGVTAILEGDESLMSRPMKRVIDPLIYMGAQISCHEDGCAPILIQRPKQRLSGLQFQSEVPSAQVKSAILLAGLYADGETSVTEPILTRDHTERMLTSFGYPIIREENTTRLMGGGRLTGTEIYVPGDISSAAFFLVGAAMTPGVELLIKEVGVNPARMGILSILWEMGAHITVENMRMFNNEPIADLRVQGAQLKGITIPTAQIPLAIDEFPAIFIAAASASGVTTLRGAKELRLKESDRIMAMATGLTTLGIAAEPLDDGIVIHGGNVKGGKVDSFGDHRIAMAFAIAGFISSEPILIENCQAVATSFPGFVEIAKQTGLDMSIEDK